MPCTKCPLNKKNAGSESLSERFSGPQAPRALRSRRPLRLSGLLGCFSGAESLSCPKGRAGPEGLSSLESPLAQTAFYQLLVFQLQGRLPASRFLRLPGPRSLKGGGRSAGVSDQADPMCLMLCYSKITFVLVIVLYSQVF